MFLENSPKKIRPLIGQKSCFYLVIRLRARVFYEAQPNWLSLVENEGE